MKLGKFFKSVIEQTPDSQENDVDELRKLFHEAFRCNDEEKMKRIISALSGEVHLLDDISILMLIRDNEVEGLSGKPLIDLGIRLGLDVPDMEV